MNPGVRRLSYLIILGSALGSACAQQGGYSRYESIGDCLQLVNFEAGWARLNEAPEDAVALRQVAFSWLPGIDPATTPRREIWFHRNDVEYLVCRLGLEREVCGKTVAAISRSPDGWSLRDGSLTVC